MNYEAWNRYVLVAVGIVGAAMYIGMLYAGLADLRERFSTVRAKATKSKARNREPGVSNKAGSRKRIRIARSRDPKPSGR